MAAIRGVFHGSTTYLDDGYGAFARGLWVVDTPGPSTARLERLEWRHVSRPIYPFDDDFEPEIRSVVGSRA